MKKTFLLILLVLSIASLAGCSNVDQKTHIQTQNSTLEKHDDHHEDEENHKQIPKSKKEITKTAQSLENPMATLDKNTYDFGEIAQYGGAVQTNFTLKNNGNTPLEIGTITTSCSCTRAEIENTKIFPGKSALITVIFDPNFHAEPLEKFKRIVFIPTNDPQLPEIELTIEVDILEGK